MATWNHRVIRKTLVDDLDEERYAIHEVHYNDAGECVGVTVNPVWPSEMNLAELQTTLIRMLHATTLPVLEYDTLKE